MPRPCAICRRLDRADIDLQLARPTTTNTEIARLVGCSETAVRRHRSEHVPGQLKIYGASAQLPDVGSLHGEYLRLYASALDSLGQAQAGVLVSIDKDGNEVRKVSVTAISRAISEARKTLDAITSLAADAADENERPMGVQAGELTDRVTHQLQRLLERHTVSTTASVADAEVVPELPAPDARTHPVPGGLSAAGGRTSPPQISLDSAKPSETALGISSHVRDVIAKDERTKALPEQQSFDDRIVLTLPNPNYPGSIAASPEERSAAGYPDIELTVEDIKSNADVVAEAIARHRAE